MEGRRALRKGIAGLPKGEGIFCFALSMRDRGGNSILVFVKASAGVSWACAREFNRAKETTMSIFMNSRGPGDSLLLGPNVTRARVGLLGRNGHHKRRAPRGQT